MKSNPNSFSSRWSSSSNSGSTVIDSSVKWTDSADGPENPRYKKLIQQGKNASTNFTGVRQTVEIKQDPSGLWEWYTKNGPGGSLQRNFISFSGLPPGAFPTFPGIVSSPDYTSADNAALGRFYTSARNCMTEMQGMTFLGEIAETINMIKNPAKGLRHAADSMSDAFAALLRRTPKGIKKAALEKRLASLYLEHVFGWLPLIHDISDGVKAYDKLMNKVVNLRCRGFGEDPRQVQSDAGNESLTQTGSFMQYTLNVTQNAQVLYYGAVQGSAIGATKMKRSADLFGFRADEFVPTLWELMPWSFLIDYFANISDIVSASTYVNSNLAWCSKTTRFEQITDRSSVPDPKLVKQLAPVPVAGGGGYAWRTKRTKVVRTASVSPGVPSLQFHLPGSDARWANISALALQNGWLAKAFRALVH